MACHSHRSALHYAADMPDAERSQDGDDRNGDPGDDIRIDRRARRLGRLGGIADQPDHVIADRRN